MNRPRGWIQDSGNIDNLIKVVEIFDNSSEGFSQISRDISKKIKDKKKIKELSLSLSNKKGYLNNPKLKYSSLVGTRTKPHIVDSIIQCLIPGQNTRLGIVDWACDNFIRFAYTLGFISHETANDSYSITEDGLELSNASKIEEKYDIVKAAFKRYPPVVRILELLFQQFNNEPNNPSLTKFEIGANLGFKGEDGFSTYSINVLIQALNTVENETEKKKIRQNWEGSSDKYARMIASWLLNKNVKWVRKTRKEIRIKLGSDEYSSSFYSYQITPLGIDAFRSCRAFSRNKGTVKNVPYEMLATKGVDKEYLRMRRAYILKYISQNRTLSQIEKFLLDKGIKTTEKSIVDDIENFQRIGLDITASVEKYRLKDKIKPIVIPKMVRNSVPNPSDLEKSKQILRNELTCLDHQFLDVLDFSIAGTKHAVQFEVRIVDLLNQIIIAKHLTGGSKPEIIAYSPADKPVNCLLFDSKSYGKGFSIPANERDKMIRYIEEYNSKDIKLNPNKWWENYKSPNYPTEDVVYGFVSSTFIGRFVEQLSYINRKTKHNGCAITAESILRKVNNVLCADNQYSIIDFFSDISNNQLSS